MAGYEFIGKEELSEIEDVFNNGGYYFGMDLTNSEQHF